MINELQELRWDDIPWEVVNLHMKRKLINGKTMTMALLRMQKGLVVPLHSHHNEQISQILSGEIQFWFGAAREKTITYGPGSVVIIPPNLPHEAEMLTDVEGIDCWSPIREDWINGTDDYLRQN